jgi:hypothetical protein
MWNLMREITTLLTNAVSIRYHDILAPKPSKWSTELLDIIGCLPEARHEWAWVIEPPDQKVFIWSI